MPPEPLSLYVHVPFCQARCTYCAFNTYVGLDDLIPAYVTAVTGEMAQLAEVVEPHAPAHTLYLGGGTPSLLAPGQVAAIIAGARAQFALRVDAEVTLEANPGTIDVARLAAYREAGVIRLSLGVQSVHPAELRLFGRRHTARQAHEALLAAREAGFDEVSADLIYGAPRQTLAGWQETLQEVTAWGPEHVSLYSLTAEPGTPLQAAIGRGRLPAPDDELAADMYDAARGWLATAGYRQYEIANWARPGHESRHNRQYWLNAPYLGLGAGAHSSIGGLRAWNVSGVADYMARIAAGERIGPPPSPAAEGWEDIDAELAMRETVILGLRLVAEGVSAAAFADRYGRSLEEAFGETIDGLIADGLVAWVGDRLRLAPRATLISNQVFVRFM